MPRNECLATLIIASGKPYEKTRVAVEIDGVTIGHCPSYLATRFLEWTDYWRYSRALVRCRAVLIAGEHPGHVDHAVRLDIELPFKVTRI